MSERNIDGPNRITDRVLCLIVDKRESCVVSAASVPGACNECGVKLCGEYSE